MPAVAVTPVRQALFVVNRRKGYVGCLSNKQKEGLESNRSNQYFESSADIL